MIINVEKKAKNIEQCLKCVWKIRRTVDRSRDVHYLDMADVKAYYMVVNMYKGSSRRR